MAVFLHNHGTLDALAEVNESVTATQPLSPCSLSPISTTFLAEGYTDDMQLSRYENVRPSSRFSFASTTCNSRELLKPRYSINTPLNECSAQLKFYYDHSFIRHVAPFFLLAIYSIIGAYIFYMIEHDNERNLLRKEKQILNQVRNQTFHQLKIVMTNKRYTDEAKLVNSREILIWYEKELTRNKLPEALEWDLWGALLFVGTVFTTIGYGNITPRTQGGQALSIIYAIIGIPLVLAILNQCSKKLTKWLSEMWIKYRTKVRFDRLKNLKARKLSRQKAQVKVTQAEPDLESGKQAKISTISYPETESEEELEMESRLDIFYPY